MEPAKEIWERALGELQLEVSKQNYTTWLKNSRGTDYKDDIFIVSAPNAFVAEWLSSRLYSLVRKTLANIIGRDVDVQFIVHSQSQPDSLIQTKQWDGGTSTKVKASKFNPQYTFDNFVVGDSNRLAYAAATEVSEKPGYSFNPLFIHGGTGQGKTHLLHAIAHAAEDNRLQAAYMSAEQFTNEFVLAVKERRIEDFQERFRNIHLLLFDDIQFIANKLQTQECFFQIFSELHNNLRQNVVTANCTPEAMTSLSSKLRSRLEWGLVVPIQPPDFETSLAILQAKAKKLTMPIPEDALQTLAQRVQGNVRQLEGALTYLVAMSKLSGTSPNPQMLTRLLGYSKEDKNLIVQSVAEYFNLPTEALSGKKRDKRTSLARQIAIYLMREEGGYSFNEIGKELGYRNHSTILHGYNKIANKISLTPHLANQLKEIRDKLTHVKK
mgnify:CR=1 FL=1